MKPRSIPTVDDTVIRHVQIADGICRLSLFSWARANGLKYAGVTRSFHRLMLHIPSLSEHVESVRRANIYGGPIFKDYLLDAVACLVWLYWRENSGAFPGLYWRVLLMLNHKPQEAVDGAFVRRLPTDVNDSASESGLAFEHNAHSVGAAYCILTNRSANMFVPCRKSVRREFDSSNCYRRMTAAPRFVRRGVFLLAVCFHGLIAPFMGVPCGKPSGLPFPIARSVNPHGVARPMTGVGVSFLSL